MILLAVDRYEDITMIYIIYEIYIYLYLYTSIGGMSLQEINVQIGFSFNGYLQLAPSK